MMIIICHLVGGVNCHYFYSQVFVFKCIFKLPMGPPEGIYTQISYICQWSLLLFDMSQMYHLKWNFVCFLKCIFKLLTRKDAYSHWLHLSVVGGVDSHYFYLTFLHCLFLNVYFYLFFRCIFKLLTREDTYSSWLHLSVVLFDFYQMHLLKRVVTSFLKCIFVHFIKCIFKLLKKRGCILHTHTGYICQWGEGSTVITAVWLLSDASS